MGFALSKDEILQSTMGAGAVPAPREYGGGGFIHQNSDWLPSRARDWSPGTKLRSIIGGSPPALACQSDIPTHPDILTSLIG